MTPPIATTTPKTPSLAPFLDVSDEVRAALADAGPVVALESTVLAHGLPWPDNIEVARAMEARVRARGAVPATIAICGGRIRVGLDDATLERIARGRSSFLKASLADLAPLLAAGGDGATTVSATAFAAARAGVPVFATGGIGGVHRGDSGDVSCDLTVLGSERVAVVAAGAKSILDLPRTLEYLETLGVPVIGYGTSELPAFYVEKSGLPLQHRVDQPEAAAELLLAHFTLGTRSAVLFANPIPPSEALDPQDFEHALGAALQAAAENKVAGKHLTPFLLAQIARETGRQSVRANRALLLHNADTAAAIAVALAKLPGWRALQPWPRSAS